MDLLTPMLATWVSTPPVGDYHYEVKLDGYRLLAHLDRSKVLLHTRNGIDYSVKLPGIAAALAGLRVTDTYLDGEIVVFDEQEIARFSLLQDALARERVQVVRYVVFDMLYHRGHDLRDTSIEVRRDRLGELLARNTSPLLLTSAWVDGEPQTLLEAAHAAGYEGLIGKLAGSPYIPGRTRQWIKLTFSHRQEGIVVGYTAPSGARTGLGALLLAVREGGRLRYIGRVGTGFSATMLGELGRTLAAMHTTTPPLSEPPPNARGVHWVTPTLVVDVEHAGFTAAGMLRKAVFLGLRPDRDAVEIVRREPLPGGAMPRTTSDAPAARRKSNEGNIVAGVRISNGTRMIDPRTGSTKYDLARFHEAIAPHLLPHLDHRPVALLRAPDGIEEETFFQKHAAARTIPGVRQMDPALDPGHAPLLAIDDVRALVGVVQMGTIELHTWNARESRIERPDRMIFDLDPDPALPFSRVRQAALLVRELLAELDLEAFVKTSGGAGLHVVVPLTPHADWDAVKAFSRLVAEHAASTLPRIFVAKSGEKNRVRRVFVDYLRNGRGSSTVSAYSVRARPGLPVSMPLSWETLESLSDPRTFHIGSVMEWLADRDADPWAAYTRTKQRLTKTIQERLQRARNTAAPVS